MNTEEIKNKIAKNNLTIFTTQDLKRWLSLSEVASQKIAERYTKKGIFIRLKRGYYALSSHVPHSFYVANVIYRPSYISLESALSYYGIIPESIYAVTSVTCKTSKNFKTLGKNFEYKRVKEKAFNGYLKRQIGESKVLIAEPEKAVADYLYFSLLGRKTMTDRFNTKEIKKKKLFQYLELFERKNLQDFSKKYL